MQLAEKIMQLRKQNGYSQEELADRIDVSRQAVSKWESGQSVPDIEKLLKLSLLFSVSTDWLLKEDEERAEPAVPHKKTARQVTRAEAEGYLSVCERTAKKTALGVAMCVLSPTVLFALLAVFSFGGISDDVAAILGVCALLCVVAGAVGIFVWSGLQTSAYEYLQKEIFSLDSETKTWVKDKQMSWRKGYITRNIIAACLCVASPIALLLTALWVEYGGNEGYVLLSLVWLLIMVSAATYLFVSAGIPTLATQRLLKEGEYSDKKSGKDVITSVYWLLAVGAYLLWSFTQNAWKISWVIWPIAGVLFAIVDRIAEWWECRK